jgi:LPXTG-motif cell wall-anchored protein
VLYKVKKYTPHFIQILGACKSLWNASQLRLASVAKNSSTSMAFGASMIASFIYLIFRRKKLFY